jgi:hypothetical protein
MKQLSLILFSVGLLVLLAGCGKPNSTAPSTQSSSGTKLITLNFGALSATNNSQDATGDVISTADQQAITQVILTYLKTKSAVSPDNVQIVIEKRHGDYVRAMLMPLKQNTDTSTVFLQHQATGWQVISLGTAFDDNFYHQNGIPQDLWLGKSVP